MAAADVEVERGSVRVRYAAWERYGGEKVLRVEEEEAGGGGWWPRENEILA